tara:strand:- start:351 stop:629 length:279 start_codon:yes stop_codon:yes gene_type:complete
VQAQGLVSTRYTSHPSRFVAQPALTVQLPAIPQNNFYMLWGLAAKEGTKEEITIQSGVWPPGKASGMLWGLPTIFHPVSVPYLMNVLPQPRQ